MLIVLRKLLKLVLVMGREAGVHAQIPAMTADNQVKVS